MSSTELSEGPIADQVESTESPLPASAAVNPIIATLSLTLI